LYIGIILHCRQAMYNKLATVPSPLTVHEFYTFYRIYHRDVSIDFNSRLQ
jgi:hypothetical protein